MLAPDALEVFKEIRATGADLSWTNMTASFILEGIGAVLNDGDPLDFVSVGEKLKELGTFEAAGGANTMLEYAMALDPRP